MSTPTDLLALVGGDQGSRIAVPAGGEVLPPPPPPPRAAEEALTPDGARGPHSGQEWDGYRIGDLLGAGGMGQVYRACELASGRLVAFKVLAAEALEDARARERFAQEARAAALVDAPQVVRLFAAGRHAGHPWLAMELVVGRTLAEEIRQRGVAGRRFAPLEAVQLTLLAARGLAAAHACRLVHRDIKPANLLLPASGGLKIADFGLARLLDGRTLTVEGAILGTPQYAAPEQGRGAEVDARSDIYSLGAVLYELLAGLPPFRGDSAESLIFQHNYAEPELPCVRNPDVPQDLQAICLTCLQKDPARRYADAGGLILDLERQAAGLAPVSAVFAPGQVSTGAEAALRRLAGWRRRWWPLAGAALLCAALASGWWWWEARQRAAMVARQEAGALRERLAALALPRPVPSTAGADLARLAGLAGEDDPLVRRGRDKLVRLAALSARLDALLAGGPADRAGAAAMRAGIADLAELVGPGGGERQERWLDWADGYDRRTAALRRRLAARLEGEGPVGTALGAAVAADLDAFAAQAGPDDPDLRAWRGRLEAGAAAEQAARQALVRLDDPAPLAQADLGPLRQAAERLAALAPEDPAIPPAMRRLEAAAAAIAGQQAVLVRHAGSADPLPAAARGACARAVDLLAAHQALGPAEERAWRARLAAGAAAQDALAARLAVLDAPRSLPADLGPALAGYEALAGFQDPRAQAWRRRFDRIRALQVRLEPLARAVPPPNGAAGELAELAALVGTDDPQVAAGRGKLAALAAALAPLERGLAGPGPLPATVDADLDRLRALVGDGDPRWRSWRGRVDGQRALARELASWDALLPMPEAVAQAAPGRLARYRALAGEDALLAAAARRQAILCAPPPPRWARSHGHDRHGPWRDLAVGGAVQRLRWLPPGTARIGSPAEEPGRDADEGQVTVRLDQGLWVADSECGQDLWLAVMGEDRAYLRDPAHPVERVSAADAAAFCARLAALLPGCTARLPSEAEWEAAARAGSAAPWGDCAGALPEAAVAHRVPGIAGARRSRQGPPNPIGLYDCAGNLWEWCLDGYGPLPSGDQVVDPVAPPGDRQVARGGSWGDPLAACRLANRAGLDPATRSRFLGFRFVVEASP